MGLSLSASSVIVSFVTAEDGNRAPILVVGKQDGGKFTVINACQGEDAKTLWEMLTVKEEKKD